ncbi:MAG TPA: CBS domain-containing protein [Candidatus Nitrosotenuis sp.]|nr:CBS domain-containing protein [Candidatus Nitrosotenuis sp.]
MKTDLKQAQIRHEDAISDIINTDIIMLQKESSLQDVIANLTMNKISKIFIYDGAKPVGVITDKDIIRFLYIDKSGRNLNQILAEELMNSICFVDKRLTCQQAAQLMLLNKISTLGIGNKENLEGIITKSDLIRYYITRQHDTSNVLDYMTISYFSAGIDDRVYELIKKMIMCDISRVVITDHEKRPVGIITTGDLFKLSIATNKMSIVQSSIANYLEKDGLWSETGFVGSQLAGEIMSHGIMTISPSIGMSDAAKMILEKKIDSLGISEDDTLLGIISKRNILLALAKESDCAVSPSQ